MKLPISRTCLSLGALLFSAALSAQDMPAPKNFSADWGADLRLRQEAFDNLPVKTDPPGITRGGNNNYFRARMRLWGELSFWEKLSLRMRLNDEVRKNLTGSNSYKFPDELVFDNLSLSVRDLFAAGSILTLGRQDLTLGSGRLFSDGTAKDGSRTAYFDGVRFDAGLSEKTKLTAFAFYTCAEDALAIGHEHRDVTGYASGFNSMDEATAGLYLSNQSFSELPFDLYAIWKHDTSWKKGDEKIPDADIYTFGTRLMPRFSDTLSGEFEFAWQCGEQDGISRSSQMSFAGLTYLLDEASDCTLSLNGLYLSGDDPDTRRNEEYNPVFGRFPWISEAMIFAYDVDGVGFWNNLLYAYLEFGITPVKGHRFSAVIGQMGAEEANGAGGGHNRGTFGRLKYALPLGEHIKTYLLGEALVPGDYYTSDKTAYFLRWELSIAF